MSLTSAHLRQRGIGTLDSRLSACPMRVGNLPALLRPGPRRRGIILITESDARNAAYFLAARHRQGYCQYSQASRAWRVSTHAFKCARISAMRIMHAAATSLWKLDCIEPGMLPDLHHWLLVPSNRTVQSTRCAVLCAMCVQQHAWTA